MKDPRRPGTGGAAPNGSPPPVHAPLVCKEAPISDVTDQVITLINTQRKKHGHPPLEADARLAAAADAHARDMAERGYFSHTSPEGTTPKERARHQGHTAYAGENIGLGYATAEAVVQGWMESIGHRRIILTPDLTQVGIGCHTNAEGRLLWAAKFGRKEKTS